VEALYKAGHKSDNDWPIFLQSTNQRLAESYGVTEVFVVTVRNKRTLRLCRDGMKNLKLTSLTQSNIKHAKPALQSIAEGMILYRNQIHTITYDNGLEFSEHQNIAKILSTNIYSAHPHSSWKGV
jgi:IS30 family transposase